HDKLQVEVEGQKDRYVDEGRDRPQTNRFELVLQPGRARPVMEPAKVPAEKERTGGTVFNRDAYRRPETPGDGSRVQGFQPPEPGGGEIAGNAANTEAVGSVRRHLDVEDGVAEADEARIGRPDRRVPGQFDDPLVIVAEAELVGRAQHAARGNPADDGFLQQGAGARDDG